MKSFLLAGASFLALMAGSATAATVTFGYTGAWVDYEITQTGSYQILAYGAGGGGANGGGGAKIQEDFQLSQGDVLKIAVGGRGGSGNSGGGGGGSFVIKGSLSYWSSPEAAAAQAMLPISMAPARAVRGNTAMAARRASARPMASAQERAKAAASGVAVMAAGIPGAAPTAAAAEARDSIQAAATEPGTPASPAPRTGTGGATYPKSRRRRAVWRVRWRRRWRRSRFFLRRRRRRWRF